MSQNVVTLKNVAYDYQDGTSALQDVSFALAQGETAALIGSNGAGKSTLLSILLGLVFPVTGSVEIYGEDLTRKNAGVLRSKLGMVFQNPDDQLFMPTVVDDVAFGPLNMGLSQAEAESRAMEMLDKVGAAQLKKRSPHRLSTGEKRAVTIAAVLAMMPEILVMDEPTAGLDPWSRRRLMNLLGQFAQTKLIATHDLDFALEVCGRVLVLQDGRIAADGPACDILRNKELLESCRLELPFRLQGCPICGEGK